MLYNFNVNCVFTLKNAVFVLYNKLYNKEKKRYNNTVGLLFNKIEINEEF